MHLESLPNLWSQLSKKTYTEKYWPKYEFSTAKQEEKKRRFEFILPIRLDDISFRDLEEDRVYIDLRKEGLKI